MIYSGPLLKLSLHSVQCGTHRFQRKSDGVWSLAALPIKDAENLGEDLSLQVDILACSRLCGPMLPLIGWLSLV